MIHKIVNKKSNLKLKILRFKFLLFHLKKVPAFDLHGTSTKKTQNTNCIIINIDSYSLLCFQVHNKVPIGNKTAECVINNQFDI